MIPARLCFDEENRLAALRSYGVLDTPREAALDDMTSLVATICEAPIAQISLVDAERQWFKAEFGIAAGETRREFSFCAHALQQHGLFVVPDATQDERFAHNPLVTGEPGIRFYAGAPLVTPEGAVLGTLCVIDRVPRALTPVQEQALRVLSRQVMAQFELSRRQARALSESEERLRIVLENARVGLVVLDRDWRYVYANQAYAEMVGQPLEGIVGQVVAEVRPAAYAERVRPRLERAFAGERVAFELCWPAAEGDRHYAITYEPWREERGEVALMVAVINDITDRKRAEEAARASEARLAAAQARAHLGSWEVDLRTRRGTWSAEMARLFHRDPALAAPSFEEFLELVHPDDRRLFAQLLAAVPGATAPRVLEHRTHPTLGPQRFLSTTIEVLRDAEGNATQLAGTTLDLTERKKLEQQFLRAQRMDGIGTLAGGIAHDLNNVLSPITMALAVMKMRFPDPASQELLGVIEASAQRGAAMVSQVLSFARGVEGQRVEVQVRHLLADLEKMLGDIFPKDIRLSATAAADLWTVPADPTQLHQVLLNLCVNARDAMPHGGALTIAASNVTLDAHYAGLNLEAQVGPHVLVEVEDTGAGIASDVLDKIFDPFFTTKEIGKGTGLGLSTSLAIVKSHGGFVRVDSSPGRGTKFQIYLPAHCGAPAPAAAAVPEAELPRGHGELVLVVDDEAAVRKITRETLEYFGYAVLLAADGAEAVTLFGERRAEIAVVLTDMNMPVMDGATTIQVLQKIDPTVVIVGASGRATGARAASLGVKHFLHKPYSAELLLQTLHEVITTDA
jgi:PAS domain S-box-containing protein